jgi:plastocyanin
MTRSILQLLIPVFLASAVAAVAGDVAGTVRARSKEPAGRIVVWLDGPKSEQSAIKKPAVVEQRSLQFMPKFIAVARGQVVQFPNHDNVAHSVYSSSPAKQFNLGTFAEDDRRSVIADRVGLIEVRCEIHANMYATVLVAPTSYFAEVDASGTFSFSGVPPGQHRIVMWRENSQPVVKPITVGATGLTTVDF